MDCSAGLWSSQTRGLRALIDVSIVERNGPILVVSTTDGRSLVRMCSASDCAYPSSCTPLCRSYRHVSRLRERNLCATGLSTPMGTAMAVRAAREGGGHARGGAGEDGEGKACSTSANAGPLSF